MPKTSHFDRFLRPILASRFLTISALLHLLIIVLFGGRVLFNKYVEPTDFTAQGDGPVSTDVPAAPPDTPQDTLPPPPTLAAPPPVPAAATAGLTALTSANSTASAFSMPLPAIAPPSISHSLTAGPAVAKFGNGPAVRLPGSMAGRGSGERKATGEKYGEKPVSEAAVLKALQWLQSQQAPDGSWGSPAFHDAFTGLALLCFLGHGETPETSHEFGVVVTNAINFFVTESAKTSSQFGGGPGGTLAANIAPYEHGIATYALCEAYTMTKDARLLPIINQAVGYIVKGQRPDGGWAYKYDLTPDISGTVQIKSDTSVSGWQIQALKAAHLTGIPGLSDTVHPVLDLAMKNMDRVFNPKNGTFGYRGPGGGYTLTGVGALAKLFWLGRADREVREALKTIESRDLVYDGPDCNLYSWYYDTQACYQAQEGAWVWWKDRFQKQLTEHQSPDGSWPVTLKNAPPPADPKKPKGGDTGGFGVKVDGDGPLYRTSFCCLMLEVFYRYLPTSKETSLGSSVEGL